MDKSGLTRRGLIAVAGAATAGAAGAVLIGQRTKKGASAAEGPAPALPRPERPVPVAFLLDENATMIDFSGPWEVFQDAGAAGVPGFDLFTVAPNAEPLTASGGMRIVPGYTLDNAPPANVIVIPAQSGGRQASPDGARKIAWLKERYAGADVIMSVCTGAFLLARTGLLDGLSATTHHDFLGAFGEQFPKIRVLRNQRFVDNGKLITAGGLSSGIEGALHVVERYYGSAARSSVADYMEYVSHTWSEA
jgi:transcriptional regulator GlxA family with amidase domain